MKGLVSTQRWNPHQCIRFFRHLPRDFSLPLLCIPLFSFWWIILTSRLPCWISPCPTSTTTSFCCSPKTFGFTFPHSTKWLLSWSVMLSVLLNPTACYLSLSNLVQHQDLTVWIWLSSCNTLFTWFLITVLGWFFPNSWLLFSRSFVCPTCLPYL